MTNSTLILNASYEPMNIVAARRAIKLILAGKADSVDDSPKEFRSQHESFKVPYVIVLRKQIKKNSSSRSAKFSRRGVLIRDDFTCAYCGKHGDTIDHILPVSKGGKSTYENCVAACKRCNHRKGNKLIGELGWAHPVVRPAPTTYMTFLLRVRSNNDQRAIWEKYLEYYLPKKV